MELLELRRRAGTDRETDRGRVSGGRGEPNCQEMGMAGMRRNYRNHVRRTAEKGIDGKGHSGRRQERRRKRGKTTQRVENGEKAVGREQERERARDRIGEEMGERRGGEGRGETGRMESS